MTIDIDIEQYRADYAEKDPESFILIDVREPEEYEAGHLPKAVNMPMSEFDDHMENIPDDRPVILVCQTGVRSAMAGDTLTANGWDDVYNLLGGTREWALNSYPLEYPEN